LHRGLGQWKRDAFESREAAAKSLTLDDVLAGLVNALLSRADAHEADERAAEIEALHHLDEAGALGTDAIVGGDTDGIEEQLAAADGARAEILEASTADAGGMKIDVKRADPVCALLDRSGARHHEDGVGPGGEGNRGFLAVEDVAIAFAARAQFDVGSIGAARRFGDTECGDNLATANSGQISTLLALVAARGSVDALEAVSPDEDGAPGRAGGLARRTALAVLRDRARSLGQSLSGYLRDLMDADAAAETNAEVIARIARDREPVDLTMDDILAARDEGRR